MLVPWAFLLLAVCHRRHSSTSAAAFGHVTALLIVALAGALLVALRLDPLKLITGADGRYSTSKVQVILWTLAIGASLLSLIVDSWVGASDGLNHVTSARFAYGDYLALLGAPFLAALAAKGIVVSQTGRGALAKTSGSPTAGQVVSDDSDNVDLVDSQFLFFNIIALAYFLGAFVPHPGRGLPNIPTILFVLTGASALGYTSNKALSGNAPTIRSVFPAKGPPGTDVEIFGNGLLFPKQSAWAGKQNLESFQEVRVLIGGLEAGVRDGSLRHDSAGEDRLTAIVPGLTAGGRYDVEVLNFRGTQSTGIVQFDAT